MLALLLASLALSASDPGYDFARSLANAGPRPAASSAERHAHLRVAKVFRRTGLSVSFERFGVPGKGRSRDVIGVFDTSASCLRIVMAHTDSMPQTPGAVDNGSGVGVLIDLAPRLKAIKPSCDVWLVATGSEERGYTGQPNHLGASALLHRVRSEGRTRDLKIALSLDEVGRGDDFELRSNASGVRDRVEGAVLRGSRGTGAQVSWTRDDGTGNSDHREFQLAGLPAAKLGQPANPCRHQPCDTASKLQQHTFVIVRRTVERLLRAS
jgi:Peptidase family M28